MAAGCVLWCWAARLADDSPEAIAFEDDALTPAVASGLLRQTQVATTWTRPSAVTWRRRRPPDPAAQHAHELRHAEAFVSLVARMMI